MITTMKTLVGLSALLSAGFVNAIDYFDPPREQAAATKILDRHPAMGGSDGPGIRTAALTTVSTKKGDRLKGVDCAGQTWPYIASECRVAANGARLRQATRTITIEQRVGENTSVLLRVPMMQMARY